MPMKAVLFVPENFHLIISEMQLPLDDVMERVKKNAKTSSRKYYFIPRFVTKSGEPFGSWMIISEDTLQSDYTFDASRIDHRFVTITRK